MAPLIGMRFLSFLILLILSAFATAIVHNSIRYRFLEPTEGFFAKWVIAWICAWLGPYVIGAWFGPVMLWNIYIIPALIGAFVGAFIMTAGFRAIARTRVHGHLESFEHHQAA